MIYFVVVRIIGSTILSIPTNVGKKKEIPQKQQKEKEIVNAGRNVHNNRLYLRQYIP